MLTGSCGFSATAFKQAVALKPQDPVSNYNLALVLYEQGNAKDALPYVQTAISSRSSQAQYFYLQGQILEKLGKDNQAISSLTEAIKKDPHYVDPMVELGKILDDMKMYDQALNFLQAAAKIRPDSIKVNNRRRGSAR